jgi:hypothetical protein
MSVKLSHNEEYLVERWERIYDVLGDGVTIEHGHGDQESNDARAIAAGLVTLATVVADALRLL